MAVFSPDKGRNGLRKGCLALQTSPQA